MSQEQTPHRHRERLRLENSLCPPKETLGISGKRGCQRFRRRRSYSPATKSRTSADIHVVYVQECVNRRQEASAESPVHTSTRSDALNFCDDAPANVGGSPCQSTATLRIHSSSCATRKPSHFPSRTYCPLFCDMVYHPVFATIEPSVGGLKTII